MTSTNEKSDRHLIRQLRERIAQRFSLLADKADDDKIEQRIRDGVVLEGATPWILMFAIFIASVGLNVNSAAVIIGAMLISPLMGPIMGTGLGIAVYDFDLVKRSLNNLGIATLLSLVVSALYFALSPLHEAQSELLARTTPTIWDVLIALFGGLAGIVGATRTERSNVIPGVAIATALMPPVCTAGYGLATGQWNIFGGALYLYTINCVFIALATVIGLRILKLKKHGFADHRMEVRVKVSLLVLALGTALPSAYLATNLVRDELFRTLSKQFIAREFKFERTHVAEMTIKPALQEIELSLIGDPVSPAVLKEIVSRLADADLGSARLVVHQAGDNRIDVAALKTSLLSDLYRDSQAALHKRDERIQLLEQELSARNAFYSKAEDIAAELRAQYPAVISVFLSEGLEIAAGSKTSGLPQLSIKSDKPISMADQQRIENWFKARTKSERVVTNFHSSSEAKKKVAAPSKTRHR